METFSLRKRLFLLAACSCVIVLIIAAIGPRHDDPADLDIGGARIHVEFSGEPFGAARTDVLNWITNAARAVTTYYGHFPTSTLNLRVASFHGRGVRHGVTYGRSSGALIRISAGLANTPGDFAEDWELTHEMVHLAFPSVPEQQHWIEEGLATYVEPWARVQAGFLTPEKVWSDLTHQMKQGLPEPGDQGLDHTHTWGRTYWGGALYCLLADVRIREKTQSQKGLQDALRGILEASGDINVDWELSKALHAGDNATGTTVLMNLYNEMKDAPLTPDLAFLWKDLGIEIIDSQVHFNESARLAAVRRAIERS